MHNQPTAVPERREADPVSPVIAGGVWLGDDDRDQPFVLQLRLPVSAADLAAALYDDDQLSPADLAADENVWGFAAAAIVQDGMNAIERRADEIVRAEAWGTLANPAWLSVCRRRVAEVTGCAPAGQATTTRRVGAQPPSAFHRPRAAHQEAASAAPDASSEALASVRTLADIAPPCRAGC
jgi:hypothetical protein